MFDYQPPIVLMTEADAFRPLGAATPSNRRHRQPAHEFDWGPYSEVMFMFSLSATGVLGAPDSWSITPRLRFAQAMTFNGSLESQGQWRTKRWFLLDDDQMDRVVVGGRAGWFAPITGPGTYFATVRNFPRHMQVDTELFTMVGGTDPRLRLSLIAYPKKG